MIANRGEIACRVIRTAKSMGIKVTTLYSEQDRYSMHSQLSDESFLLGPSPASESYLNQDKVIEIAKSRGIQAIHPGYGFLSENAIFADRCEKEGIVFIGPPSSAIRDMGSKSASKNIMIKAGVPVVPGYHGENQSDELLHVEAEKIGYPVLIKAVLGGGGKGMKLVHRKEDLQDGIDSARREAKKSFDDDKLLLEKYILKPRHVEVQVFCDNFGNAVYLFERDCSVQRRHQKVIEEAPAPEISEELRVKLGTAAVNAAKAVGYRGAGTVEFILDENHNFYFMEMNTRLQVEHPITEMITGQDLVEWQLRVASNQELPLTQEQLKINGHAFEARIYAENPRNSFLPSPGPIIELKQPMTNDSVRVDTGVREGDVVSLFYDPMIAKLIVHGKDRETALKKLAKALDEFHVRGLHTNLSFLKTLAVHPEFVKANIDTGFIEKFREDLLPEKVAPLDDINFVFTTLRAFMEESSYSFMSQGDPWGIKDSKRINIKNVKEYVWEDPESDYEVKAKLSVENGKKGEENIRIKLDETTEFVVKNLKRSGEDISAWVQKVGGLESRLTFTVSNIQDTYYVGHNQINRVQQGGFTVEGAEVQGGLLAPMPGKVVRIVIEEGQEVKKGDSLIILEAMKMEHTIRAPADGKVKKVNYRVGDLVEEKAELVEIESQ